MATLVEVTQSQPKVQDITLKLSRSEAADLKVYINDWFNRNYGMSSASYYRDLNPTYAAIVKALTGKASADITKVALSVF